MAEFKGLRVAFLATDGVEEVELTKPLEALEKEGAKVEVITPDQKTIQAVNHLDKGKKIKADRALADAKPDDYDALVLPGGAVNADTLRVVPEVQKFVRAFNDAGKPMAVICHAPWLLVSCGLVRGRRLTSYHTIQDDIRNAGGNWEDKEVIEDRNWVTSRQPKDIPAFVDAFFGLLKRTPVLQHS